MLELPELSEYIKKGVSMYVAESGDKKVDTMILPSMSLEKEDDDKGARFHPGPLTHKNAAKKINLFLTGRRPRPHSPGPGLQTPAFPWLWP